MLARIAMIAITTNSSISVKARPLASATEEVFEILMCSSVLLMVLILAKGATAHFTAQAVRVRAGGTAENRFKEPFP